MIRFKGILSEECRKERSLRVYKNLLVMGWFGVVFMTATGVILCVLKHTWYPIILSLIGVIGLIGVYITKNKNSARVYTVIEIDNEFISVLALGLSTEAVGIISFSKEEIILIASHVRRV